VTSLWHDVRLAARGLMRSRGYAAVAVLMLGIGTGAATALFSVVQGVLLRPLPYPDPDRIVRVWGASPRGNPLNATDPNFHDWQRELRSFSGMAQYQSGPASVLGAGEPVRRMVAWVSADFFSVLGVPHAAGRGFAPEEQQPGGAPAVVVSHAFWPDQLGAGPELARG
jgi:putative ABC transport system permease protein